MQITFFQKVPEQKTYSKADVNSQCTKEIKMINKYIIKIFYFTDQQKNEIKNKKPLLYVSN